MKAPMEDAAAISREIIHGCYAGNMEPYISRLCDKSVRMGAGDRELVGECAIRSWLESLVLEHPYEIYQEEYVPVFVSCRFQAVTAKISAGVPGQDQSGIYAAYIFLYELIRRETKLVLVHANYEPLRPFVSKLDDPVLQISAYQVLRDLLLESPEKRRLPIPIGITTLYLQPDTIVYVRSMKKKACFFCVDRVVESRLTFGEASAILPEDFCPIHRSYTVNTRYIMSVRRYKVSMVTGEDLPIPIHAYEKVRTEIDRRISERAGEN